MAIQNNSMDDHQAGEAKNGSIKYTAPSYEDIRKDLNTLKTDVAHLAADVKKAGADKAQEALGYVNDQIGSLKETGTGALGKIEEGIKAKPGQSVTIAFVAGMLASYLLARK